MGFTVISFFFCLPQVFDVIYPSHRGVHRIMNPPWFIMERVRGGEAGVSWVRWGQGWEFSRNGMAMEAVF